MNEKGKSVYIFEQLQALIQKFMKYITLVKKQELLKADNYWRHPILYQQKTSLPQHLLKNPYDIYMEQRDQKYNQEEIKKKLEAEKMFNEHKKYKNPLNNYDDWDDSLPSQAHILESFQQKNEKNGINKTQSQKQQSQ
ncbi:hypothetical protein PPERSA_04475 [Pseudocohnilembus persalinus]|uniref:Uncharacterized protein n=1 Tax=Pseudocohnilembus persalinus TaxID=266149 RepID=A0A0V0QQX3_PSEPJ|nr:hypothetical protein PPERSA_04475 [Pseudocohnilembus persalinus]|eukprot:KRX04660.1 hypothetical protein PPERSA_04475 [Pseudocohnilembus persalinus]